MNDIQRRVLSPMDNVMPRFYAKLIFAFRCSPGQEPKKVRDFLQEGLHHASVDIPSIAGKVFELSGEGAAKGALELHTHPSWVPTVHFQDLTDTLDYNDWVDEGLPQDELDPTRFFPAMEMPDIHKGVPVFTAQANFLAGGLLLAVGMFHSVIDGTSGMALAKKWAEYTRRLQGAHEDDGPSLELLPLSADYGLLTDLWLAEGHEPVTLHNLKNGERGSDDPDLWRLLGLDPFNPSPKPFSLDTEPQSQWTPPSMQSTIFYISQQSLAELKASANDNATGQSKSSISANDALMALLWRGIIRARFPENDELSLMAGAEGEDEETTLDTTFDGRANFSSGLPWTYLGSLIFISTTRMKRSELISPATSLASIAREIRRAANRITTSRIHAAFGLAAALPDYNNLTFPFATFAGAEVCITSWIAWSLFDLNFGPIFANGGRPEFLRPPRREFDAVCRRCVVLPLQTHGGCEILVSLTSDEMRRLEKDAEFARYAHIVCH